MGDRRKGKEKMKDVAPTELPNDLPKNCKFNMSLRDSRNNKCVLLEVTNQGRLGTCWTITVNRAVAAHLYIQGRVRKLYALSANHLYANIEEKFANGFLKSYNGLRTFLKEKGLILEEDCKCFVDKSNKIISTNACNKVKDRNVFKIKELIIVEGSKVNETDVIDLLNTRGPIVAKIVTSETYRKTKKDEVYFGVKDSDEEPENHLILLTGIDTKNGVHYFEFQNTWGLHWGDAGFGKLARKESLPKGSQSLILLYLYPELLDQDLDVQI